MSSCVTRDDLLFEMSLSSTGTIKQQLTTNLGQKAPTYFQSLNLFVTGKSSRSEFDDTIRQILDAPNLVQLHNALIISLFDATAVHKRPPTPPQPTQPKQPPRKRRRTLLPYQGPGTPEDARTLRSARLKRWALTVGKRERERIHTLGSASPPSDLPKKDADETAQERGVILLSERGGISPDLPLVTVLKPCIEPPGSRLPVHLHAITRAPTIQHIADRMNLICAQNNLGAPSRTVPSLMNLACEVLISPAPAILN